MKTNPYTVKLPSIGLRSPEHEVFARDPAVRREIVTIPIRVGDEATLKASGLRFRIVTVDEFQPARGNSTSKERGTRLDPIRRVAFGGE
jgi:hypothetical protein